MDALAYALVMEELARGYASVADQCGLVELVGTLLAEHGTRGAAASATSARCCAPSAAAPMPSPRPRPAPTSPRIRTTATRTARGWRLDGAKLWIHNAPVCDFAVVLARTDKAAGQRGMSIFLVDRDLPGVSRRPPRSTRWASAPRRSARCTSTTWSCRDDALLGPESRGFHMMMSVLDKGRVGIAALAVGIAQAGLEAAVDYARTRRQFGQPIADFQGVQWMLADMAKDMPGGAPADPRRRREAGRGRAARPWPARWPSASPATSRSPHTANAVQIFGGSGYIRGFEVERLYRDAKITQIYEGTNQIQRTIIARELLQAVGRLTDPSP